MVADTVAAGRAVWIAALFLPAGQHAAGTIWPPMKCRALFTVKFPGRGADAVPLSLEGRRPLPWRVFPRHCVYVWLLMVR